MASESPDRSKQQQSSGETTSQGSSVPPRPATPPPPPVDPRTLLGGGQPAPSGDAARAQAAGGADAPPGGDSDAERPGAAGDTRRSGGGVDQPTTAFAFRARGASASATGTGDDSTGAGGTGGGTGDRAPEAHTPDDAAGSDEPDDTGDTGDGAADDAGAAKDEGDDRLRAAVAAWVSSGDSPAEDDAEPANEAEAGDNGPDDASTEDTAGTAEDASTNHAGTADDATDADDVRANTPDEPAADDAESADAEDTDQDRTDPDRADSKRADADRSDPEGANADSADSKRADAGRSDAEDADAQGELESGATDENVGTAGKGADRGTAALRAIPDPAHSDSGGESDAADQDDEVQGDASDQGPDENADADDSSPGSIAEAFRALSPDSDSDPEGKPDTGSTPDSEDKPDSGSEGEPDTSSSSAPDSSPSPAPAPGSGSGSGSEDKPDAEASSESDPEIAAKPDAVAEPEVTPKPDAEAKPDVTAKPDAGTKPQTGPAPDAKPEAGKSAADPRPESGVEQTSRFVPLRSPDDPQPTPPPSPPASVPLPPAGPPAPPPAPPAGPPAGPPAPAGPPDGPPVAEAERTRQQPLPPVPGQRPLDLLAELTNKPAPLETPMRTLVRRVKIWTPLLGLLVLLVIGAQLLRPLPEPELKLTAQPSHTFDGSKPAISWPTSGQAALEVDGLGSLGTSGEQKPVPIASVAKTMTAYIMLRDHPMKAGSEGKKIKVDKQAEEDAGLSAQGESTVDVQEGETLTQQEALNAVMIASANNVARLVARWHSKTEAEFVKKMNETADELGMKNTTYTDPSGLRKETVSTAEDQVKLGKAAMKHEAFRESVRLSSYKDRNGKQQNNWNRLVPEYGTVGIKTGTTTAAGGNLLFAAEKEVGGTKQMIIGAVLSQHQPPIIDSVLAAGKDLILSAQDALESEVIIKKGTVVGAVDDQLGGSTPLVATRDVTAVGWPGLKVELGLEAGKKGVPSTADPGTRVGEVTVGKGLGQVKVPVALDDELTEPGTGARLTRVF